jgi:hypothetical protein
LGLLQRAKRRDAQAAECFSLAIDVLRRCNATAYLKEAEEALASLQ